MEPMLGSNRDARRQPSLIRSSLIGEIAKLCDSLGVDHLALTDQVGIDRRLMDDPDLRLPLPELVELLEVAAAKSGADDFGLRLAETTRLPDFGPLVLLMREECGPRCTR